MPWYMLINWTLGLSVEVIAALFLYLGLSSIEIDTRRIYKYLQVAFTSSWHMSGVSCW